MKIKYRLQKVVQGIRTQVETLGESNDIDALKVFANDELEASKSHRWNSDWFPAPNVVDVSSQNVSSRSWKSFSGRHGGCYRIRRFNKSV